MFVIRSLIRLFSQVFILATARVVKSKKTIFFLVNIKSVKGNNIDFIKSDIKRAKIIISGRGNYLFCENAAITNSSLVIQGLNNQVILNKGVKLRNSNLIVRGSNCRVIIGDNTTFGGIRVINVGRGNDVVIGENCLFSDNIELWASDTHSIYDVDGKFINSERPIVIGDNVWIGAYVKILKGVTVGSGSIVGMNSMITKDILPKTLNIGNPARSIKENISWNLKYENE